MRKIKRKIKRKKNPAPKFLQKTPWIGKYFTPEPIPGAFRVQDGIISIEGKDASKVSKIFSNLATVLGTSTPIYFSDGRKRYQINIIRETKGEMSAEEMARQQQMAFLASMGMGE